jgi:hypothetical protein
MSILIYPRLPSVSVVDAPLIANTAVESSLLGSAGQCSFEPGAIGEGTNLQLVMFGKFSNRATGPGSIQLRAKLGSTAVWSSGALSIPASAHADITFWLNVLLIGRAGGANAKIMGCGLLQAVLGSQTDFLLPAGSPVDSATFDATVALDLDITAQFSVADPGNKIQLLGYQVLA